jgi:hypothetical protein
MKTYKELCDGKPSNALAAMIEGLKEFSQKPNFKIDMGTFGEAEEDDEICVGCAACVAVQTLSGVAYGPNQIESSIRRAYASGVDVSDQDEFELAIDDVRTGDFERLEEYLGLKRDSLEFLNKRWYLSSNDWESDIPKVEQAVSELQALGL